MPIRFHGGLCSRLVALGLMAALVGQTILAAGLNREANSTLVLPLEPYQFSMVDAFPALKFNDPVAIVSPPGETNRLFILERGGRIQVITNLANPTKTLFLDITGPVDPTGEGGLLGLAFHPGYQTNRYFYVYYTLSTTTSVGTGFHDRVARFEISPDNPNQALADSELPLITQLDQASNHNGGDVHFGPDGYLYVSLGDEGDGGDSFNNSKFITNDFFCAILRIDVDHRPGSFSPNPHPASTTNYAIPPDNPFIGATNFNGVVTDPNTVRTEFWAVGLRNPFRFSFDPVTGRLYCGDVGQGAWEEIDIIVKGGNYGWNYREGTHQFVGNPPQGVTLNGPIFEYDRNFGACVIGGVVYRGTKIPQLFGEYVFGDFSSGNIWALHYDGVNVSNFRQLTSLGGVCAFGQDPANGDILMVQASGTVPVYRLVYTSDSGTPLPPTLDDTGAFANLATLQPEPGIVAYDLNVPFWSDHARKSRWFSVPDINDEIGFSSNGNWSFPEGTVWIKHFELELTTGVPASARRLETRFLVRNSSGVYGVTYRWDNTQTNAFLVSEDGMDETFLVHDGGTVRTQVWHYPGRTECVTCHTPAGGLALGFNTFQLNRDHDYSGTVTNQILGLSQMGYFTTSVTNVAGALMYAQASNEAATVEHRVRSYLGANCVQCHQPGGTGRGYWDARLITPLSEAGIVNGALVDYGGDTNNKVIKPGSLEHSMMLGRISDLGPRHMPPLATSELNQEAIALLARWITNDLAVFSVNLPTGHLDYTENDGPVILDPGATTTIAGGTSLAGGSLTIEFTLNGATEDRWAVRHVGNGNGEIGVSGNVVSYGGVTIGTLAGGTSGSEPLVATFNSSVTPAAAQALLRNVTYENVSQTPSTLTRTVRATLANGGGSTSSQAIMTISVQSVPAVPVVVWNLPADTVYGTPLTAAQLNPSANVPGTFVFDPPIGHLLNAGNDRVLAATFTPQDTSNYIPVTASNLITVTKAPLVITADHKSKVYGQPNPPLTAVYTGFVNGDTASSLDTAVNLTTTATPSSPAGSYPIVASGAADANYTISYADGTLTVTKASLVITAENTSKVYGAPLPTLTAVYSGFVNGDTATGLDTPVSLGTTAIDGSPAGIYVITANGASDADYTITHVNGTLTITKAPLVVTADDKTKVYGGALPGLTASYSGLVNGDTPASLDTPVSLSTAATAGSPAGSYPITAGDASDANYVISHVNGTLSVTRAPMTITAENRTKVYGAALPALTATYSGLVNGDNAAALDTPVNLNTSATASSPAGSYPIVAAGAADANYAISFVDGILTVTKAPLVIAADGKSKVYGQANPPLTASYNGFVNGETTTDLDAPVALITSATVSSPAGAYPIVPSGAAGANYTIIYVDGTLTVTKAPLVITADDKRKVYGQPNPPLTAGYGGFVSGETAVDLDTAVSLSTSAAASSPVGAYPIIATGASDANYQITLTDGVLTIEPNAQVNSITLESGGQVRIRFTGLSGRAYRVEAAGDLSFWATAGTVQPDSNGEGEFLESAVPAGSAARFYRLVWP